MAAIADTAPSLDNHGSSQSRKRRKKNRFLKQGYHKAERHDARRVAAKAFLSGITRDSHLQRREPVASEETASAPYSPGPTSVASRRALVISEDVSLHLQPPTPDVELLATLCDFPIEQSLSPSSKSWEQAMSPEQLKSCLIQRSQSCVEPPNLGMSPRRQAQHLPLGRTHSMAMPEVPAPVIPCCSRSVHTDLFTSLQIHSGTHFLLMLTELCCLPEGSHLPCILYYLTIRMKRSSGEFYHN